MAGLVVAMATIVGSGVYTDLTTCLHSIPIVEAAHNTKGSSTDKIYLTFRYPSPCISSHQRIHSSRSSSRLHAVSWTHYNVSVGVFIQQIFAAFIISVHIIIH